MHFVHYLVSKVLWDLLYLLDIHISTDAI